MFKSIIGKDLILFQVMQPNVVFQPPPPLPVTDHSVINLILEQNKTSSKIKGYWKLNADLLNHDDSCAYLKKIIAEFKVKRMPCGIKWKYLKRKLREY